MRRAIDEVIRRHDALRTTFSADGGGQKLSPTSLTLRRATARSLLRTRTAIAAQFAALPRRGRRASPSDLDARPSSSRCNS